MNSKICVHLQIVVLLAIDVPVSTVAGALPVKTLTAVRALEARGMPSPVDGLKVESIGYPEAAPRANHPGHVVGLRRWRGWRFELRDRVQLIRGLLLLRVRLQMGMMMVMMVMVVMMRGLRRHA